MHAHKYDVCTLPDQLLRHTTYINIKNISCFLFVMADGVGFGMDFVFLPLAYSCNDSPLQPWVKTYCCEREREKALYR